MDLLILQDFKAVISSRLVSFRAGEIISDREYDVNSLLKAGAALQHYTSEFSELVEKFRAARSSQSLDSMTPLLRSQARSVFTLEGGLAVRLVNKTGADSVKGSIVASGVVDRGFELTSSDDFEPIGVVYEDGIPDGEECLVVISGVAYVLLQTGTTATRGYWARTSTSEAGRADITTVSAPGFILTHFAEIGHCLETSTGPLALCLLHFN